MFQVFLTKRLAFLFLPDSFPAHSPFLHSGEWYYRLDASFFAWASRVVPRTVAAGQAEPYWLEVIEDMRIHLSLTAPAELARAASLIASSAKVTLPDITAEVAFRVHDGDVPPWQGFRAAVSEDRLPAAPVTGELVDGAEDQLLTHRLERERELEAKRPEFFRWLGEELHNLGN